MPRIDIFQQLSKKRNFDRNLRRIETLLNDKSGIRIEIQTDLFPVTEPKTQSLSVVDFVDAFAFKSWKQRSQCINCKDMCAELGLEIYIAGSASFDEDSYAILNYLEYASNILNLVKYVTLKKNCTFAKMDTYRAAKENVETCLAWLNHETKAIEKEQKVLVVEKNPATTAVAEIVDADMAYDIIKYNHFMLKGDIEAKKAILIRLGNDLEPKRKQLASIDSNIEDGIFFMLNNMNLRHNNRSKKDKNYKEYVAKMRKDKLEEWYDELYQMMLLAYLELDQQDRNERVKELKAKVNGSKV